MLYLILNSDETFELRWVDYYSIRYGIFSNDFEYSCFKLNSCVQLITLNFSGFDEIMNLDAGTLPPTTTGQNPNTND